ncbi:hypothetical protein DICPUDRAFT_81198 [Dictyostelium purpureum]|uniref:NADH-ubiquinone oxidoreductase 21kDa subunit N-terminal domain-containing protein n=1 Tax=Dictyostelium purpureum TaxID=5786 RepID=F0ZSS6_DICPU|nr:uncharacterized protein DICPUDRAFT_81198 [Dictyostelium purpureum]EGC32997.1 hypothetical protein DICPUDRAFT_81198 [Dictyostelium purpureum]|eukprot:XP_003290467.1 hypothetical protein DICPUDRAFT_81198 [Dictyostelium purpureum]
MDQPNRLVDQSLITKPSLPRYPIIFREPTFKQTRDNFRASDYALAIFGPMALSSYVYYQTYLDKRAVARWSIVIVPTCYFVAAKLSYRRLTGDKENEKECKKYGVEFVKNTTPFNI